MTIGGEISFVAVGVTSILGLTNMTVALSRLDDDERSKFNLGRQGEANVVKILGYKYLNRAINQHVDSGERKTLTYKAFGDLVKSLEPQGFGRLIRHPLVTK